jgi:ribosome biogenesis protein ERB1
MEGRDEVLTVDDLKLIRRIKEQKFPQVEVDPFPDLVEFFTDRPEIHPLSSASEPKRRFIPSKWEAKRIMKIVGSIRRGWREQGRLNKELAEKPKVWAIWDDSSDPLLGQPKNHIPAPKLALPKNSESYNPPEEYLPDEEEKKALLEDIKENKLLYVPQKYVAESC